jgi:hypothetical protein
MRGAIQGACRVQFLAIPEALEPEVRRVWEDGIFADFTLMDPHDPPGLTASYLEGIQEPIRELHALGIQLVYLTSRGSMSGVAMTMTDFLIAPTPCYFRVSGDSSAPIHMLGAPCVEGHRTAFISSGEDDGGFVRVWLSTHAVEESFEQSGAPWCATCSMAGVGQG